MQYLSTIALLISTSLGTVAVAAGNTTPNPMTTQLIEEFSLQEAELPLRDNPAWHPQRIVISLPTSMSEGAPGLEQLLSTAAPGVELVFDRSETMTPSAIFISVGRGASTVTTDLLAALDSGKLYGAGLDVTDPEPLPADSPLWHMSNVIITPHVSAMGPDSMRRVMAIVVENLRRYVAGERLLNVVNMQAGY